MQREGMGLASMMLRRVPGLLAQLVCVASVASSIAASAHVSCGSGDLCPGAAATAIVGIFCKWSSVLTFECKPKTLVYMSAPHTLQRPARTTRAPAAANTATKISV